jgi:hypothetical protein
MSAITDEKVEYSLFTMLKPVLLFSTLLTASFVTASLVTLGMSAPAQAENSTFAPAIISPKFTPDPIQLEGVAGGNQTAKDVAGTAETPTGACLGFVNDQPNHILELKSFFKYLSIVADGSADTTIVIKGPGGTWCNDDYQGKNAGVSGQWLPGRYEVWVGGYTKDRSATYKLKISETQ